MYSFTDWHDDLYAQKMWETSFHKAEKNIKENLKVRL